MLDHKVVSIEGQLTLGALIWFLLLVATLVVEHVAPGGKLSRANAAGIWLLSCVAADVYKQIRKSFESLCTDVQILIYFFFAILLIWRSLCFVNTKEFVASIPKEVIINKYVTYLILRMFGFF